MASQQILLDGNFTRGLFVNSPIIRYPFQVNNDKTAITIDRQYRVRGSTWIPGQVGVDRDPRFSDAYLMAEPEPTPTGISDLVAMTRTYARVPATQTTYSTRVITKPSPATVGSTPITFRSYPSDVVTTLGVSYFYGSYFWGGNNKIYGTMRGVTPTVTVATGGTFTVTYKTSTTGALNYNETTANIAAAINALADVVTDGLTIVVSGNFTSSTFLIQCSAGSTSTKFSINSASLSPAAAQTIYVFLAAPTQQNVSIGYRIALTAHGFTASDLLVTNTSGGVTTGYLLTNPANWSIIDANTIVANLSSLTGTVSNTIGQWYRDYTPGTDRVGTRLSQRFYLPGITAGITTAADIPIPDLLLNDVNFLAAVLAYSSGHQSYDATELVRWNGWPIYTQTFQEINMADV
jgi:hypothetical protein